MPLYEYECEDHGTFEAIQSLAEYSAPAPCPSCATPGRKLISAPHLSSMARSEVVARDRNERSSHEPRISSTPGSCSHSGPCNHGSKRSPAGQLKAYKGKRPWVMEHA